MNRQTWGDKRAHTSPGRGEVALAAFAAAVGETGYTGRTVCELVDGEDPAHSLEADLQRLAEADSGPGRSTAPRT